MGLYELMVFLHVAAAVALLSGSIVASPAVRAAVRRAQTTQEMRAYLAIGRPLLVLEPVSAIVLLATGVYLTSTAGFWALGWIQVSLAAWVVNAGVAATMVKPAIGRVAAAAIAQPDDDVGEHLDTLRWSDRWSIGGDVLLANDAATLYLMMMKPDLAGALALVVGANLAISGVRAARHGFAHVTPRPGDSPTRGSTSP
jgi:uncharacterized membrane protein